MLGFITTVGQVLAAAPRWLLGLSAGLLVVAWILRRLRREGHVWPRVALIVGAVVTLTLAMRAGAQVVARERGAATFREALAREEALVAERYRTAFSAFSESCRAGASANDELCRDLAASLLGNPSCEAECLQLLATRPDLSDDTDTDDAPASDAGASDAAPAP